MCSLDTFIEALIQEKYKLIKIGVIKEFKEHALVVHDGRSSHNIQSKVKRKTMSCVESKKEGYSNPSIILEDPKVKKEIKDISVPISIEDSIHNLYA